MFFVLLYISYVNLFPVTEHNWLIEVQRSTCVINVQLIVASPRQLCQRAKSMKLRDTKPPICELVFTRPMLYVVFLVIASEAIPLLKSMVTVSVFLYYDIVRQSGPRLRIPCCGSLGILLRPTMRQLEVNEPTSLSIFAPSFLEEETSFSLFCV